MDEQDAARDLRSIFRKYRWAAAVLLLGIFLMALPEKREDDPKPPEPVSAPDSIQQELENLLQHLEGAGKVRLLLTEAAGAETHYQTDADIKSDGQSRSDTVLITSADRSQSGLVQRTDPPRYLGAVVLCQGAGDPKVKLAVVDAVATATGLGADRISVWKMK